MTDRSKGPRRGASPGRRRARWGARAAGAPAARAVDRPPARAAPPARPPRPPPRRLPPPRRRRPRPLPPRLRRSTSMRRLSVSRLSPAGQRRLVAAGLFAAAAAFTYWNFFSDGLPIIWGPTASAAEIAAGRELFEHEWTPNDPLAKGDGLG